MKMQVEELLEDIRLIFPKKENTIFVHCNGNGLAGVGNQEQIWAWASNQCRIEMSSAINPVVCQFTPQNYPENHENITSAEAITIQKVKGNYYSKLSLSFRLEEFR